jgi:hypothetical protein
MRTHIDDKGFKLQWEPISDIFGLMKDRASNIVVIGD